jgi:uncharacterized protein (TIGR00369 family)
MSQDDRPTVTDLGEGADPPAPPPGYKLIKLWPKGNFADVNGPLYRRIEEGKLTVAFRVEARHCNPYDNCHGGMLMTFADMVLGMGSNFAEKLNRFLPTVNLTGDFLAAVPLGSWVEGRAEVLRVTRNLVFAQCLVTADGTPALRVSGIMKMGAPFDPAAREAAKGEANRA